MRSYKFVKQVGVELEGGWTNPSFDIGGDGSVNVKANYVGEVASPALNPEEVAAWVLKHYPDAVNETCGIHVHVSLSRTLYYARVMEYEFQEYLLKRLEKWGTEKKVNPQHPFWGRLRGENTYCTLKHWPERQIKRQDKHGERYTALNYTWARFGTVECRLLPAFKLQERASQAIFQIINSFEDFMKEYKHGREKPERLVVSLDETPITIPKIELEVKHKDLRRISNDIPINDHIKIVTRI